ncbi:MAG TPA: OmpH family outer membrane protein [Kofleriaceae bacterium]|jgi:Skp family chaperone for outer membrane proteins
MNRYVALGCLGLGLMVSPLLGGIGSSAVPTLKVAVIDLRNTLTTTPAGKRAAEQFEKTFKTKQATLDKQQEDLKKADADLQKQKAVLKPEVFDAKRQELEKKFVDLQQTYLKLQTQLNADREKMIEDLEKQAEPKIVALAKAEGVTVVLEKSAALYFDAALDLTQKLNAEMK